MGKKKKRAPKIWCYYCDREFDDENVLVQHQKARHFKCHVCYKKLSTASGMAIHVLQVHKETVTKVPNAKPERDSTDIEIYGMDGIPPQMLAAYNKQHGLDEKPSKLPKIEIPSSILIPLRSSGFHVSSTIIPTMPSQFTNCEQTQFIPISRPFQLPCQPPLPPVPPLLMPKMPPHHPPIDLKTSSLDNTASHVVDSTLHSNLTLKTSTPPALMSNKSTVVAEEAKKWVYFVWDDEEMSMEERRMSLAKHKVEDEISEMKKLEAKIGKMIADSWLAMRMGFTLPRQH